MHIGNLKKYSLFIVSISIFVILMNCEDYQTKNYTMEVTDQIAKQTMLDTNYIEKESIAIKKDTLGNYTLRGETIELSQALDSLEEIKPSDSIHYEVNISTSNAKGLSLNIQSSGEFILYTNEHIEINVVKDNGEIITPKSSSIPPELMAGYSEIPEEQEYPESVIKKRLVYDLNEDTYLLQFIPTEQTNLKKIKLSLLAKQ